MNKNTVILILAILVVAISLFFAASRKQEPKIEISHEMLTTQIEQLGNLEVLKYHVQDMVEYEKTRRILPNSKAQIKIVGEIIACVDLTKVQHGDIYTDGDSVSITLPIPEICHYKIDHSRTKVYNIDYGFWETAEIIDDAYRQAEQHLYQQALKVDLADQSHKNAVEVVTSMLHAMGFARVHIAFKAAPEELFEHSLKINFKRK